MKKLNTITKLKKAMLVALLGVGCTSSLMADDMYFKFFAIHPGLVGLYNSSDETKIAVLNFNYWNGTHQLKEFKVLRKSSIEINVLVASSIQILDHKDYLPKNNH